jgi:hypothetical protein
MNGDLRLRLRRMVERGPVAESGRCIGGGTRVASTPECSVVVIRLSPCCFMIVLLLTRCNREIPCDSPELREPPFGVCPIYHSVTILAYTAWPAGKDSPIRADWHDLLLAFEY